MPHDEFEHILDDYKESHDLNLDTELGAESWMEVINALQARRRQAPRPALPAGSEGPALGRHRRRVLDLDERPRRHLPHAQRHSRKLGHRRQRPGDGVRQHGRELRHRRRLHPRSVHRRQALLRRIPRQRAGRGRRRRHPHAGADLQLAQGRPEIRRQVARRGDAASLQTAHRSRRSASRRTIATCRTSSSRWSRASSTCCRPATANAPPRPR